MAKGKMKKSLIFAVFFIAILVTTLTLAFVIQSLTTPLNIAHGTIGSGSFEINNTSGGTVTNIDCIVDEVAYKSWVTFSNCPSALNDGDVFTVNFNVAVPQYTSPSSPYYDITLRISGTGALDHTQNLQVIVPSSPGLSITADVDMEGYDGDDDTENFTVTNTGNVDLINIVFDYEQDDLTDGDNDTITLGFDPSTITSLIAGDDSEVEVTATIDSDMDYGTYSTDVEVSTLSPTAVSATMHVTIRVKKEYCDSGQQGSRLVITKIEEPDTGDDFTLPATIPVEVDVRNDYDEDLDVVLEAQLFDISDDVYVVKGEDEISIDEDETGTLKVDLKIPMDVNEGHVHIVIIKIYEDGNEDDQCADDFVVVDINKDKNKVILDKATVTPEIVECDAEFSVQLKFGNAGRNDEDKVKVRIYNTNLEIDETKTTSIDEDEYDTVNFNLLHVPEDAEESEYVLNIEWFYDYDDDDDEYDESGNSEVTFTVEGNCIVPVYDVIISTQQLSGAKPDEEFTVKVTLTNTGTEETTYTISAIGYSGWATLESLDPETLTLEADEAGYTYIKLTPTETGSQEFTVRVEFEDQTETQDISVNVMSKSEAAGWFEQAWFTIKHNWEWVLVNAALAIAIIVLFILLLTKGHRHKPKHVYVVGGKGMARAKGPTEISLARTRTAKKTKARTRRKPRKKKR